MRRSPPRPMAPPRAGALPDAAGRITELANRMAGHAGRLVVMGQQGHVMDLAFLERLEQQLTALESETKERLRGKSTRSTVEGFVENRAA